MSERLLVNSENLVSPSVESFPFTTRRVVSGLTVFALAFTLNTAALESSAASPSVVESVYSQAEIPVLRVVDKNAKKEITAIVETSEYGKSGLNRPLKVVSLKPPVVKSKVLATFEIHGYEDSYAKYGQVLVNIANKVIEHFSVHPKDLGTTELFVVPSANPDGLIDGTTNNGKGRCQISGGIDINRDFDYNWSKKTNSRNKTLSPFSAPESRALRDLVIKTKPNDVIDVHGWLGTRHSKTQKIVEKATGKVTYKTTYWTTPGTSYGISSLCQFFQKSIGIGRTSSLFGVPGYFAGWASKYAQRTALIELPGPKTNPQKVVDAFIKLLASK